MDKTALKNFAIYAREKLIKDIEDKARLIGIKEERIVEPLSQSTKDMKVFAIGQNDTYRIVGHDVIKYEKLIQELDKRTKEENYQTAYKTLIEEVAYTWFNRIIAIRFMEVNDYMPDRLRILSSERDGVKEPEFVTNYRDTDIGISEEEFEYLDKLKLDGSNKAMEEIFKILFIKQCNALNTNLPDLFERTDDYAELLLNISYEDPQGVVRKLLDDIGEEPFDISKNGQIEIIGWLYQYYNEVPRDKVINIYKGNVKKEDIPAATQLFTTEWVVKYMVENSLGKYWLERNPKSKIKEDMNYLMPGEIETIEEKISPEDIKVFDNAMGSGHILIYSFDLLMKIYLEEGYMERQAAESIIENNLYGLDIDKRAYQLAYFAVMMKVRQYSRRILNKDIKNNLKEFKDSTDIDKTHLEYMGISLSKEDKKKALRSINYLIKEFENAKEIGSILKLEKIDIESLRKFIRDRKTEGQSTFADTNIEETVEKLEHIIDITEMLINKYNVMVTNPPYLNKMSPKLKKYVSENYPNYKKDLFSVFMFNNVEMCKKGGYSAYMTPFVWMFISSYEKLRENIISTKHISSLIQMEYSAFEEATVPICTFVLQNEKNSKKGKYIRLSDFKGGMEVQRLKILEAIDNPSCEYYYETDEDNFELIPGRPIAYWASEIVRNIFKKGKSFIKFTEPKSGVMTGNDKRFIRIWFEINNLKMSTNSYSYEDMKLSNKKWFPVTRGGIYRKWYGNLESVVNLENEGYEIKYENSNNFRLRDSKYYFKQGLTWTMITTNKLSVRFVPEGILFGNGGPTCFLENQLMFFMGLLNSIIIDKIVLILNPTMNIVINDICRLPVLERYSNEISDTVDNSILLSKTDWDSFETSWDFKIHPLLDIDKQGQVTNNIEEAYSNWKQYSNNNFNKLKENEERLNEIFIEIYGLEDELNKYVSDKDITIAKIFDDKKDIYEDIKGNKYILNKEDVIKSFISYGVGCIFGRYSLDEKGLVYAGGEFDINRYKKIKPVEDNIALITDEEYFEDDLVSRFVEFVRISFGEDNLEENLKFIADSLKGKGTAREKIRNYFVNDFYKDHVKKYKKTPIYWLYDSSAGKTKKQSQNGFKALIYMHRYGADTTGKVRIDYLHKLQRIYERRMDFLNDDMVHNKDAKKVAQSEKEQEKILKQVKECKDYDEKISHIALSRIDIDLDDGVGVNYQKVQTDDKGEKFEILSKI
ncbi:MAG: BREX-1 system adenine-specific DNA-methyltransferase PglX [Anaerococcus sp.]